jgi:hypothetical protein
MPSSFNQLFNVLGNQQKQQNRQTQPGKNRHCIHCGNAVTDSADICEKCNSWLLPNQCVFCYSAVKPGQKFCGSCGNPPAGILCPNCNKISILDICPGCQKPLSKRAAPALEAIRQSPEIIALLAVAEKSKTSPSGSSINDDPGIDLQQLEAYLNQADSPLEKKPAAGFKMNEKDQDFSGTLKQIDAAGEPSDKDEAAMQEHIQQIALLQSKYFADNQSARLFYASIRVLIPQIKKCQRVLGWRCNFANVVHPNGPGGCGDPSKGGEWICEDDVEWTGVDSFIFNGEEFKPQHVANP